MLRVDAKGDAQLDPTRILQLSVQGTLDGLCDIIKTAASGIFDDLLDEVLINEDDTQDRRSLSPPPLAARARRAILASEYGYSTDKTPFRVTRSRLAVKLKGVRAIVCVLQEFDNDGKLTMVLDNLDTSWQGRLGGPFVSDFLRGRFVTVIFLKFLAGSDPFVRSGALVDRNTRCLVRIICSSS